MGGGVGGAEIVISLLHFFEFFYLLQITSSEDGRVGENAEILLLFFRTGVCDGVGWGGGKNITVKFEFETVF